MSDRIHILTTKYGFTPDDPRWRYLRASAARHGLEVGGFGGDVFPPYYTARVTDMMAYLGSIPDKYVLYTDPGDTLITRWDNDEALKTLDFYGCPMVITAERNCFPYPEWAGKYPVVTTPWKYVNGGGFFGERLFIIDCLKKIDAYCKVRKYPIELASDQGLWTWWYLETRSLALDFQCRLFQSMYLNEDDDVYLEDGEVRNKYFPDSRPMVMHWNGRWPGIEEWFQKLYV